MKKKFFLTITALLLSVVMMAKGGSFEAGKGTFLLNGKPFIVKAAELHYARIPQPYWEHRIKMCKALGMNTICIYIFWNYHEETEGNFNWSGDRNVADFVKLCQKNGMYVIVRPGPYVCAEWEMGGLPWWLLKNKDIQLRTQDPAFLNRVKAFEAEVGKQLAPLTIQNGGPIIMVQVENEYGSYDTNKPYVSEIRDCLRSVGFDKTTLFQCDWSSNFEQNALPDLLWTMNFGTGANVLDQFKKVKQLRPDTPMMCSEYWSGWFDGWGRAHETRPADAMVKGIGTMLENGISFSLYMTHGGTSFGHWAGSNVPGYQPDCTSYDYDAPIDEQGAATPKYYELRELLQKYSDTKLPAVPKALPVVSFPEVTLKAVSTPVDEIMAKPAIESQDIQSMEQFDMGYGSIMYTTTMPAVKANSYIRINNVADYAIVCIGKKKIGELYRGSNNENTLLIKEDVAEGEKLSIFVEAMGRINYSKEIKDPKGITKSVEVFAKAGQHEVTYNLKDWKIYLFPAETTYNYEGTFTVSKVGDTYLDMSSWGKGMVFVNGHNIGRFWNVGPQQTLFLPGCWLKKGQNEIKVYDITGPKKPVVSGKTKPVIAELHKEYLPKDGVKITINKKETVQKKTQTAAGNDAAPGAK